MGRGKEKTALVGYLLYTLGYFILLFHFILTRALGGGRLDDNHFTDEETEFQRGKGTWLRSHS